MVPSSNVLILFLCILAVLRAEHLWSVKFPAPDNHLSRIQQRFPLVDLLQHDHDQSSYIFLVPNAYLTSLARFIHRSHGSYRVLSTDPKRTWQTPSHRPKRRAPADNPLDESYYQHFLSYDEQRAWQQLLSSSPVTRRLVRLHNIGHTYENRSLTVIQILANPLRRPRQPRRKYAIFIDGGMHAREWLSIGVANYLLIQLLALRGKDRQIQEILRHFEIYILPMMNPDGYEYSRHRDRLWRKNRMPTEHSNYWNGDQGCVGIDLNRNFPYQWNTTFGSSKEECSPSYRGPKPASESEVQSVVNFLQRRKGSQSKFYAYFNLHAYGRFWLLPWTYTMFERVPNYDELLERSKRVAANATNGTYRVGQASTVLYPCSGTSIDFASTFLSHAITFELPPLFSGLPLCFEHNKTPDYTCSVGFLTGAERIEIDGKEVLQAIVQYMYSVIQDYFV